MAHKRMFSKTITESDEFLEMPTSTRLLYYDLGMNADDDGFVQPIKIMRMTGAKNDDLNLLVARKYVIPFDHGKVLVITDWRINNTIRKDRYTETIYLEYKRLLNVGGNGKYELGKPNGNQMATVGMHSIGEDRIGKDRIEKKRKDIVVVKNDDEVFDFKKELEKMETNQRREIQIVALYWKYNGFNLENKLQFQEAIKRELRPAIKLKGYSNERIVQTMDWLTNKTKIDWKLETIHKYIDFNTNILKGN